MDIRTKLVFALVSVALASMLALALAMYGSVTRELEEIRLEQLSGLAEFKVESLEGIVDGWHDRVRLVASGNELRSTLAAYGRAPDAVTAARLRGLLDDVRRAAPVIRQLRVHGPAGELVAESSPSDGPDAARLEAARPDAAQLDLARLDPAEDIGSGEPWLRGVVFPVGGGLPFVALAAPMDFGGERVGYLQALLSTEQIRDISTNYEGLGETGEAMVVVSDDDGPRVLHPVRAAPVHGDATGDMALFEGAGLRLESGGPAGGALEGRERRFEGGVIDYRGQAVWAATDFLSATGWGVVVKVDAAEQRQPIVDFRDDVIRLAVALAAFAILFGTVLGIRFAQPIHLLAEAANRIRDGDLSARAGVAREDEVGLLAQTFDRMAAELEAQVELLKEFRLFFDMSLDMMCIAATDGYFKRVNASFTRELGWSEEELLARPFVSMVHPDDVDATLAEIEKLRSGTPTISFQNRYLCKDGAYKQLSWRSTPERGTGRLYAIARVVGPESSESP